MRSIRVLILLVVFALVTAACSSSSDDTTTITTTVETTTSSSLPDSLGDLPSMPDSLENLAGYEGTPSVANQVTPPPGLSKEHPEKVLMERPNGDPPCLIDRDEIIAGADPQRVANALNAKGISPDKHQIVGLPRGLDPENLPPGLDPENLPPGLDPENLPPGSDRQLPPGLFAYRLDPTAIGPIGAADILNDAGIPASPRYVFMPSDRWKFGPATQPAKSDQASFDDQGTFSTSGEGTVVVIDTGITRSSPPGTAGESIVDSLDLNTSEENQEPVGLHPSLVGHGTFIAGIVRHLVPDADIWVRTAMVVEGREKSVIDESSLVAAIDAALDNELKPAGGVVNLSLGTYACSSEQIPLELAGRIAEIAASEQDVVFVAASGNDNTSDNDPPFWPAGFAEPLDDETLETWQNESLEDVVDLLTYISNAKIVAAVGAAAHQESGWTQADFSNEPAMTVLAPGVNVVSDYPGPNGYGYATWDGTSFAAPHVSALIAGCRGQMTYREALAALFDPTSSIMTEPLCMTTP